MDEFERRQLAELFREDDRLRAELAEWMARREAEASVQKSERDDILYREHDNNAPAAAAADDGAGLCATDPPAEDGEDEFTTAIEKFTETTTRALEDDARELALLRNENRELKALLSSALEKFAKLEGRVDALTALLGQQRPKLWTPGDVG